MKYMGSKARIAKNILPIILKGKSSKTCYVEPFCGGCNVIDKIPGFRIANDNNKYLIAMLIALQSGERFTHDISKEVYSVARNQFNSGYGALSDAYIGWIGFMGSANGRFFEGGYSGISNTLIGTQRNYIEESIRNIYRQLPLLNGIKFTCVDYRNMEIPPKSVIYCDPPYAETKKYATSNSFNTDEFFNWCRSLKKEGHSVFISEYNAPDDFEFIWQSEVKSSLSANGVAGGNKISVEKLFTLTI